MTVRVNRNGRSAYEEFATEGELEDLRNSNFSFGQAGPAIDQAGAALDAQSPPAPRSLGPDPFSPVLNEAALEEAGLDVERFKFLVCDPRPGLEEPDPCPICRPNPFAYVPDYRMMGEGETFFDGKDCTQCVVYSFSSPAIDGGVPIEKFERDGKFIKEQKERAVKYALDLFNKSEFITIYSYKEKPPKVDKFNIAGGVVAGGTAGAVVGGIPGAVIGATIGGVLDFMIPPKVPGYDLEVREENVVDSLVALATTEYHVPIQRKARTRLLVKIPVEVFDRLPERLVQEPDTEFETKLEVTYEGNQFVPTLRRISKAFNVYHGESKRWATYEGGRFVTATSFAESSNNSDTRERVYLNLEKEADQIDRFREAVKDWITRKEIGMSFSPLRPNRVPEKITFKFKKKDNNPEEIELRQVVFNKPGCEDVTIGKNGRYKGLFRELNATMKRIDSRTLYYIGSGPEIDVDLTARTPTPWLQVATDYTYPPLEVLYGSNGNTIYDQNRIDKCLVKNTSVDKDFDQLMCEIENTVLGAPDAFLQAFSQGADPQSCNKEEDALKKAGQAFATTPERASQIFAASAAEAKRKIAVDDPYLAIVLDEIGAAAKAARSNTNQFFSEEGFSELGGLNNESLNIENTPKNRREVRKDFRDYYRDNQKGFMARVNDRIGWCGWLALIKAAADCVAKGLGEESSTKALAKAAFGAMDDNYLGRSFLGLPPEEQQRIADKIEAELGDVPAPWDIGYQAGNYAGGTFSLRERKLANQIADGTLQPGTAEYEQAIAELDSTGFDIIAPPELVDLAERLNAGDLGETSFDAYSQLLLSGFYVTAPNANPAVDLFRVQQAGQESQQELLQRLRKFNRNFVFDSESVGGFGLDSEGELAFNQGESPPGSGGTYGEALGNIQKEITDAYRRVILDTVGADSLLQTMNRIPGAPIVARILKNSPCKINSPIKANPRLDNFLNTLEFDICQWDVDLTLPVFSTGPLAIGAFLQDLTTRLLLALTNAIIDTALAIFAQILKFILDKLLSLACETLGSLGANLAGLASGNNQFLNLLRENLCPEATEEDLLESLQKLFSVLGGDNYPCLQELSNQEMANFIEDMSLMLTQGQLLQLLAGEANEETIRLALEVAATSNSPCIREVFSDPGSIQNFFPALGTFIPDLDRLRDVIGTTPAALQPIYPCAPEVLTRIDDLRCDLLGQKGLTKRQCREELDKLKDQALQDLQDLLDLLQNGPMSNFPPLNSEPGCPPNGFLPATDPFLADANSQVTNVLFDRVEEAHLRDLMGNIDFFTGHGGVLNAALSDTMGRPFKKHNFMIRNFGAPLANDLGFFETFSDNAIREPGKESRNKGPIIDIYGNDLNNDDVSNISNYSRGGYPPTVGAWLAQNYRTFEPEFKTVNVPGGYDSIDEALKELEKTEKKNRERIKARKKYLRLWIDEFNFDTRNTWTEKYQRAADDLLVGAEREIFGPDPTKETMKHKVNSPEQRTFNALNGKNISVAGVLSGNRVPKRWGDSVKKRLRDIKIDGKRFDPEEHKSFVDAFGKKARLLQPPDTSSADVRLKYESFPVENNRGDDLGSPYSVSVEYDYNLFDEDGELINENIYNLKVVEEITNIKGDPLSNSDIKKLGPDLPPESIVGDEPGYSFTSYDLKIQGTDDQDVVGLLGSLGVSSDIPDSYQIEYLFRYFENIYREATDSTDRRVREISSEAGLRRYFKGPKSPDEKINVFDSINSGFLQRISYLVSTGETGKGNKGQKAPDDYDIGKIGAKKNDERRKQVGLDQFSKAFKFGYDPYKQPKVVYMDAEKYGGLLGKRDPKNAPRPFYVQTRRYDGWMDIAEALVPELDGCEPASKPIFELSDIKEAVDNFTNQVPRDDRLQGDPLCAVEAPFDRILAPEDAGRMEGAIRAIIRIYALDVFLRAVPIFTAFEINGANYDNLLESFIAERMRQGLYQDGVRRSNATDEEYYFRFIEQTVNNTVRKIDAGLLTRESAPGAADGDFNAAEEDALNKIIQTVNGYYREFAGQPEVLSDVAIKTQDAFKRLFSTPASSKVIQVGSGSSKFSKVQAKAAKKLAFEQTLRENEADALVLLGPYIREELEALKNKFVSTLPALVTNVDHLFCVNNEWIRGSVFEGGPFDVQSDPGDGSTHNIQKLKTNGELRPKQNNPNFKRSQPDTEWPFVLEKYIKIEDKSRRVPGASKRAENLYNVVNIQDWDRYVKEKKAEGLKGDISEFWGEPTPAGETEFIENHNHTYEIDFKGNGRTSVHTDALGNTHYHEIIEGEVQRSKLNPQDNGHVHNIPVEGWKFGLRICYMPTKASHGPFVEMNRELMTQEQIMNNKAFSVTEKDGNNRVLIPIASAELPIPDQEFTNFSPSSYDVYCLIEELVKTAEYKTLFKYIFPIPRYTSLLAVHSTMSFFDAIGNSGYPSEGGDMWEVAGGRKNKKFRKWVRGPQAFKDSRQKAKILFTSLYESSQAIDFDTSNPTDPVSGPDSIRELIRPKVNFEDGLRWWERGRLLSRPFNKDGEECE